MKPSFTIRKFLIPLLCFIGGWSLGLLTIQSSAASFFPKAANSGSNPITEKNNHDLSKPLASSDVVAAFTHRIPPGSSIPLWKYLAAAGKRSGTEASWLKLPSLTAPYSLSPEHPVTDEFASFFKLTPDERSRLDAIVSDVYAQQKAYESQHYTAFVPNNPDSDFGIKIPAYPQKGAELFDKINRGLLSVLGSERHGVLTDWGAEDLEKNLTGVGIYDREVWIQKPGQNDASWKAVYFERGADGHYRQFSTASQSLEELEQAIRFPLSSLPEMKTPAVKK